MAFQRRFEDLDARRAHLQAGGGPERVARQHEQGKLTARERLGLLFDEDSFIEFGLWVSHRCPDLAGREYPADGVVTGKGEVMGRPVFAFSQDFTVGGGAVGERHAAKIVEMLATALKCGVPVVGFNDGGGARIQEGVDALSGYGRIFYHNTLLSGVVPQISVIAGPCAGGAAYSPALTDFVIMVENTAHMFIAGPEVIRAATGEVISEEDLGGARAHAAIAGNVQFSAADEREAVGIVKALLTYLPQNNMETPPSRPFDGTVIDDESLDWVIPEDPRAAYDVHEVITRLVDDGVFLEYMREFAPNLVCGFAHLGGLSVGIVANQPAVMAGVLDINAADKAARFIRTCNVYNIPLITLVDVPGFLPGVAQEHGGIIRHGAKVIYSYCEATVPKISVVVRKAMGGAYIAMSSKQMRTDLAYAWPSAEIAVMGPEGAINILYRDEIRKAADPAARRKELLQDYVDRFHNPYSAADMGQIDEVIEPSSTRLRLVNAMEILRSKVASNPAKKHGVMPV